MKIPFIVVLTLLGASKVTESSAPTGRTDLDLGTLSEEDILLHSENVYKPAVNNGIQYQTVTYRGNYTTRISAIQASEVGLTQYATVRIISGGVGWNWVVLKFQSERGYEFNYLLNIWGR